MSLDVATPAAVVDLDRLEVNLARWQAHCDEHGLASRPHVKTHKCVEIARRRVELGARGVTVQTLYEAEVMVGAGIEDLLLPYNLVGGRKLEWLAQLLRRASVAVSADDEALLPGLAGAATDAGRELTVLVDCDTGLGRTGVSSPAAAAELAAAIARTNGLRFGGLVTYPAPPGSLAFLTAASELIERRGLPIETVSVGGTPTMWDSGELRPVVNEYRVGTYVFNDHNAVGLGRGNARRRGTDDRRDRGQPPRRPGDPRRGQQGPQLRRRCGGRLRRRSGSARPRRLEQLNEEHGYLALAGGDDLELGQQVRIVPNHVCVAVNLFDELDRREAAGRSSCAGRSARGR